MLQPIRLFPGMRGYNQQAFAKIGVPIPLAKAAADHLGPGTQRKAERRANLKRCLAEGAAE